MPLIQIDDKTVSTNDSQLHTQLKILAAQLNTSLGKLVDIYLKRGFQLRLERLEESDIEKIKAMLNKE